MIKKVKPNFLKLPNKMKPMAIETKAIKKTPPAATSLAILAKPLYTGEVKLIKVSIEVLTISQKITIPKVKSKIANSNLLSLKKHEKTKTIVATTI